MLFSLTNPEIAIMMMAIFFFAVLLGFPIAFTLMAMGVGFGYYAYYDPTRWSIYLIIEFFQHCLFQNTYTIMDNNVLNSSTIIFIYGLLS